MPVAYVRTVKTASGATAVQIVYANRRGSRQIEHLGSAHSAKELDILKRVAAQRLSEGQGQLDLGLPEEEPAMTLFGPDEPFPPAEPT